MTKDESSICNRFSPHKNEGKNRLGVSPSSESRRDDLTTHYNAPDRFLLSKIFSIHDAREDFKKYSNSESDIEACFREWLYDVISGVNVVESILYCPDPDNDENIIPEIRLSD